jgi:hypothetical protein
MPLLKHIRTSITAILLITTLVITATISIKPVFAPRTCAGCGEFSKLTGEFVQKVLNKQQSPNSDNVVQFRILTAQFERDVISAVLNDHLSQIPGITKIYAEYFLQHSVEGEDWIPYTQEVLRIFCKPCV